MAPPSLLGQPELYKPNTKPKLKTPISGEPFMDLMVANFNQIILQNSLPPMGFTENGSATFLSSGNPCLDFFFHVVPDTPPLGLTQKLQRAWTHNRQTTLKLICNLRGVRVTGKSHKEGFYTVALWLFNYHPRTLAHNVGSFADFGYIKDLLEILFRLLEGLDVRKLQKAEWLGVEKSKSKYIVKPAITREIRVLNAEERSKNEKEKVRALREKKRVAMAKKVVDRYRGDANFQLLHEKISDHFAECLKFDIGFLNSKELKKISLAAKWCPSIDSSFDRYTLLCESIAKKVFQRVLYPEYETVEEANYAYRVKDRLRKHVLVPLRKVLELPEVYIGANKWNEIPYERVASIAMKFHKEKFLKTQRDLANIYRIALLPHDIIASLEDEDGGLVGELQWKRMVEDLVKLGKMRNCLAVSDVSGSMSGIPMEVSVALGLLVSELSEEPWKGKIITFSPNPQLHIVKGDSLRSRTEFVRRMDWGMNTNFQKVFDLIIGVAVNGKLKEEQMVKRLFVFSDMEFDEASANGWETDYGVIKGKFGEKGYGSAVPQIVFWNLRDSRATPVPATEKGVALLSGFLKNLLKIFLDNEGDISPEDIMEAAISGVEYSKLLVLD
ncbi:hypothetical protein UlMin_039961 [Ulmus minor]